MTMLLPDLRIVALGVLFYILENNYFGWNPLPASGIEVACDGISLLIFSLAFLRSKTS